MTAALSDVETTVPEPADQVLSVRYAGRTVRRSDVLHDYAAYGEPDGDLEMDYNFYVVTGPDGITLFDTGYDVAARDWLGEIPGTTTPECLDLLGIDPRDVVRVVTSHFHYDHIGHLALFERAEVVAAREEYDYWSGKRARDGLAGEFATDADLDAVERARAEGRLTLLDGPTRVAPHLTVVPVGGHTPGESLLVVGTRERPLLLAADAAHFGIQVENDWPFFAFTDLDRMRRGLGRIHAVAHALGATVVPGHDGRTRHEHPAAPGPGGRVAVVLG
ncbi:glyoxylase-like metal-dependent hydrolase (beta-lactamase superfamily II) [Actinomycetospora succinea]|uniref:Glyoxylase-like metal-dependent hydrolase (Beta-lactamase superfamily II) n=1 Tax=Actinomycetospora succinea TaxID=663603 RepID=A0A4V3DAC9_9PSEU|nr:N-acyl homoserine lactonase family protein [Actinomycetospora succinea]TDQ61198.1 glyoxylase-like metal-dependent hydrolase (beta-lactamase superfamily II) [Actinomycetospora succinea]